MPQLPRLLHGALRAANQKLLLPLDPKMPRVVCNIRENRHERFTRASSSQALAKRPIEMRNERRNEIRPQSLPVFLEQSHRFPVVYANDALQHAHQLRAAQRPAVLQHAVVDVLNAQPGEPPNDIDRVEYL